MYSVILRAGGTLIGLCNIFESVLKHSYFVSPITSTDNRLPPAPPKLRPYGALQN